ncbi:BnaC01g14500D [Brassica napus]|uniref:(rape) hypothetical protein n=1 Tax=Brassica napus TaxID=3708 RepID=A0A078F8P8_BRANA|nr:unnamed protein product [Brassica napus]CDY10835.1 BnaC01g14500D [Brassica napus]
MQLEPGLHLERSPPNCVVQLKLLMGSPGPKVFHQFCCSGHYHLTFDHQCSCKRDI